MLDHRYGEAALALRALGEERVSVELISPEPLFWYRPLAVAEPFRLGEVMHFELPELAAAAGATFSLGTLVSVDPTHHLAHISPGGAIPYDMLLIACGAVPKPAVPGALTFRGPADVEKVEHLLAEIEAGEVHSVVFAVPSGAVWSLPVYELALMTAAWLAARGIVGVGLALVTPEDEPLGLFGHEASRAIQALLDERGIVFHGRSHPVEARDGKLLVVPESEVAADRVVATPRLQGQRIEGIPQTADSFIPVDTHARVTGVSDVYAAGDVTSFPDRESRVELTLHVGGKPPTLQEPLRFFRMMFSALTRVIGYVRRFPRQPVQDRRHLDTPFIVGCSAVEPADAGTNRAKRAHH
jgi:sulfide:quinone oxidoreductase